MKTEQFKSLVAGEGLKTTRQREQILRTFLGSPGHQNLAEIYAQVSKVNPKVGYITVYRTLKLLTRLGLAIPRKFGDGETRYERVLKGSHHDHLICLDCGKIIEFEDHGLETLQDSIALRYRFKPFHHRLELYGLCSTCGSKKKGKEKR